MRPWLQKFYPVLRLGSGESLVWHFQTPVLYWSATNPYWPRRKNRNTPLICTRPIVSLYFPGFSALKQGKPQQYTSHLYCSTGKFLVPDILNPPYIFTSLLNRSGNTVSSFLVPDILNPQISSPAFLTGAFYRSQEVCEAHQAV